MSVMSQCYSKLLDLSETRHLHGSEQYLIETKHMFITIAKHNGKSIPTHPLSQKSGIGAFPIKQMI